MTEAKPQTRSQGSLQTSGSLLETLGAFFHVCRGPRPGGHFFQFESSEAYDIALNSTSRAVNRETDAAGCLK